MTRWILKRGVGVACLLLASCSSQVENLIVDKFSLRDVRIEGHDVPMVRGDQQKRLYGAVTIADREARLGQYYEMTWCLDGQVIEPNEPVTVIFRYRQAATGSKLKLLSKRYSAGTPRGKIEFNIIGEDYIKGGRVLSWKTELIYGGRVIDSKQSYLWRP